MFRFLALSFLHHFPGLCRALLGAAVCTSVIAATPAGASGLVFGTNGHDAWANPTWQNYNADLAFQIMSQRNLRSYRVDVSNNAAGYAALTKLVALGQKYGITIRPMLDVSSGKASDAYTITKMFASSIHVWELGNELNLLGTSRFSQEIGLMIQARAGVMQAAAETGQPLQTVINIAATYGGNVGLNSAGTSYPFLDQAISSGLQFDYISFHYYPASYDYSQGWMKFYLNPLRIYQKPVLLNESNCQQIYTGDNGNSSACNADETSLMWLVKFNYGDLVQEFNMYEIIDDPSLSGTEGHFGMMFNLSSPKLTMGTATQYAAGCAALPIPAMVTTKQLSNSQFVQEFYGASLNRAPSSSELSSWTQWLNMGGKNTRSALIAASLTTSEFQYDAALMDNQAYVARLFIAILGRRVDPSALAYFSGELNANKATRAQLIQSLEASTEAQARAL